MEHRNSRREVNVSFLVTAKGLPRSNVRLELSGISTALVIVHRRAHLILLQYPPPFFRLDPALERIISSIDSVIQVAQPELPMSARPAITLEWGAEWLTRA